MAIRSIPPENFIERFMAQHLTLFRAYYLVPKLHLAHAGNIRYGGKLF